MPGGVNSPVRAFNSVGGSPVFITSASSAYLKDVDGNEYIDYIGSWGPMILGHAHSSVVRAIGEAARKGTSFGTPCPVEIELAEEIIKRVQSVEMVRFVNSGTEAKMSAVRLARAATGRNLILKFEGCYHGHADGFLIKAGSGVATMGLPDSPGVTTGAAQDTKTAPFNDLTKVDEIFRLSGDEIAAVIVEPVAGNMGVIPPVKGFLEGLRKICDENGTLLIFDEVMTGFRVHPGGAQELYQIKPDLSAFGKIIGGGVPVGAYGGGADLMNLIAPEGPVYQAGTLSGNPLAMSAGLATMRLLNADTYEKIESNTANLEDGLNETANEVGVDLCIQRVGSMLTVFFGVDEVKNLMDAQRADHQRFGRFFHAMLENGVHLPPSGYEAWFISAAHNDTVITDTLDAVREALKKVKSE